jgi:glycosyltransferase involved in cell wall biosynthesis
MASFGDVHWKKDPGGIPMGFARLGYRVSLVIGKMYSSALPSHLRIYETGVASSRGFGRYFNALTYSLTLFRILRAEKPHVYLQLHTFPYSMPALVLYKAANPNARLALKLDLDPDWESDAHNRAQRALFLLALFLSSLIYDLIIVETPCSHKSLLKGLLPLPWKIHVIPNGYTPPSKAIGAHPGRREKVVLSVARVSRQKGLDILIRAFANIHTEFPDWKLRIVGPIDDPDYLESLRNLVVQTGLSDSVDFAGPVSEEELEAEYERASIFALTSYWEGSPIARIEAMARGLPVLTSEAGCGSQYAAFGTVVVPVGDVEATSGGLKRLMEDAKLREEISRRQLRAVLTWDQVAVRIEELLEHQHKSDEIPCRRDKATSS